MRKPTNLTIEEDLLPKARRFLGWKDRTSSVSVADLVNYLLEVHLEGNKRLGVRPDPSRPFGVAPTYTK